MDVAYFICIPPLTYAYTHAFAFHAYKPERWRRFPDENRQRIMEQIMYKEILAHAQGKVDMILEFFQDNMTTNFSDQVVMGEQIENRLKTDKI